MDNNEISMLMDVKMDIHDKRNEIHKYKAWTKCQVKIEAIKCLPCFLRLTFQPFEKDNEKGCEFSLDGEKSFTISINVPGVTISLASSRTKQFSYGLFWTHSRRDCFIYFALETEIACKKHMKWIKKSLKNLELFRQVFLEQRRNSRPGNVLPLEAGAAMSVKADRESSQLMFGGTLGSLPQLQDDWNTSSWSRRVSKTSAIYEEIFENSKLSRRVSRASIASGIYEEMKPFSPETNCNTISEEASSVQEQELQPPPVPPLPPSRKRVNTLEIVQHIPFHDIQRSNTNPESELAKKKKYKVMLDSIFGTRSKRAETLIKVHGSAVDNLIETPAYENDFIATKRQRQSRRIIELSQSKRNSFSSPDLSKINFLDTFDEEKVADLLQNTFESNYDLDLTTHSLDESSIPSTPVVQSATTLLAQIKAKSGSVESLNISEQIPTNFNFSACNCSKINLVGANGAVAQNSLHKQKILVDDLTGYCVMAPIAKKIPSEVALRSTGSTSSGYSTGSYTSSATSTCTNSTEDHLKTNKKKEESTETGQVKATKINKISEDESVVYENMYHTAAPAAKCSENLCYGDTNNLSEHLYENLLTIKAAQELEAPNLNNPTMSTSTPNDSPLTCSPVVNISNGEESFYQTPRKSIISIDDKIPSYYPNSCDTVKMRRSVQSTTQSGPSPKTRNSIDKSLGLKHLVNVKLHREKKENLYISSPPKVLEQRISKKILPSNNESKTSKGSKDKKPSVLKVSENVYSVRHSVKKTTSPINNNDNKQTNANNTQSTNSDSKDLLHGDLAHLAILRNIDFKFDDTKTFQKTKMMSNVSTNQQMSFEPNENYENCYQAAENANRLLHKYATLARYGGESKPLYVRPVSVQQQRSPRSHHLLQVNQDTNTFPVNAVTKSPHASPSSGASTMSQSSISKLESPTTVDLQNLQGLKKFASLPRFKKIDFSPLKMRINNVLQRSNNHHNQQQDT